jgi:hypothetical protein
MAATVAASAIWTRGFTRLDAQIEENRKYWSSLVDAMPPKPVIVAAWAACGGIYGAGYAAVRPALPRQPLAAGALYGAGACVTSAGLSRWIRRHYDLEPEPSVRALTIRSLTAPMLHGAAIGFLANLMSR